MKSVTENECTLEIKNSKFIGLIFPIEKNTDIDILLAQAKNKYQNATHYCYAYILDQKRYATDDKEPNGTAGIPILQVLEKQELNHVLCIIIRYFGKIKLGANGLIRAYTKTTTEVIKNHTIILKEAYLVKISFSYSNLKQINYLLKDKKNIQKKFKNNITYTLALENEEINKIKKIKEISIKIIKKIYLP